MIKTRDDLIYALTLAAELEHSLCCQYLFAAYSLKKHPDEGVTWPQLSAIQDWQTVVLEIARQEMEHLGFVNNLLTAIGGAPHYRRPNFPQERSAYGVALEGKLERFSLEALDRFIEYEKPQTPEAMELLTVPTVPDYDSIHQLYRVIRAAFDGFEERELFIGPSEAQVDSRAIGLNNEQRIYDVTLFAVTDRSTALRAIDLIVLEGEGVVQDPHGPPNPDSHYERLLRIRDAFRAERARDPDFDPARPVIDNPITRTSHRETRGGNLLTNRDSLAVADLFNTAYEVLLFSLIRFYTRTDETAEELLGLQQTAFFPLMVMALRPLAEVLTLLPAGPDHPCRTAGPSFEFYRSVQFLPHKESAWRVILEKLEEMATRCDQVKHVHPRLVFMHENFARIAMNFKRYMNVA